LESIAPERRGIPPARRPALAHAMRNTLPASNTLFAAYCAVNVTSLRALMETQKQEAKMRVRLKKLERGAVSIKLKR